MGRDMTEVPEDTWPSAVKRAGNRAQAAALKAQAAEGGLRFEAHLPSSLAVWLLDRIAPTPAKRPSLSSG
jgi:hypothetical protein